MRKIGFSEKFHSPYEPRNAYNGKPFEVSRRVLYCEDDEELEDLPMWHIRFTDGTVLTAWPEEICEEL